MAGLSRRGFLAASAGMAVALGVPERALAARLAEPATPADVPTTLEQTIRLTAPKYRQYRHLTVGSGSRTFPLRRTRQGRESGSSQTPQIHRIPRSPQRYSHHRCPIASPPRCDGGAERVVVGRQFSPAGHADRQRRRGDGPGDAGGATQSADRSAHAGRLQHRRQRRHDFAAGTAVVHRPARRRAGDAELRQARDLRGVQVWNESVFAYHPEDPANDPYGAYGFPQIPGMLQSAVSQTVESGGLAAPGTRCTATTTPPSSGPWPSTTRCAAGQSVTAKRPSGSRSPRTSSAAGRRT